MKLSISVTNFSWRDGPLARRLADIARIADEGGLHGVCVADHLLQADPGTFFVTDHYVGYPMVLARLDRLTAADLDKLLRRAITGATR